MCLLIIVTKMYHPFDEQIRTPRTATEPAALVIDWDKWNEARTNHDERPRSRRRKSHDMYMDVTEEDVMSMTNVDLDGYMDWFGRTWIDTEKQTAKGKDADFRDAILNMFPVEQKKSHEDEENDQDLDEDVQERLERLRTVQSSMISRVSVADLDVPDDEADTPLQPGDHYKQYRSEKDVPVKGKPFLVAAAQLVGLTAADMVIALFQIERLLQKWAEKSRREEALQVNSMAEEAEAANASAAVNE